MQSSCNCGYEIAQRCNGNCGNENGSFVDEESFSTQSGVPIVTARPGEGGKLVRISGKSDTRKFLSELGFIVGDRIGVVSQNCGNMILDVKGSRIAVDKSLAAKLFFAPE
jgi:ferrous iron transport protein A